MHGAPCFVDYMLVVDFEATCADTSGFCPAEIIEFPSVLLSTRTLEVVDEFQVYVTPEVRADACAACLAV